MLIPWYSNFNGPNQIRMLISFGNRHHLSIDDKNVSILMEIQWNRKTSQFSIYSIIANNMFIDGIRIQTIVRKKIIWNQTKKETHQYLMSYDKKALQIDSMKMGTLLLFIPKCFGKRNECDGKSIWMRIKLFGCRRTHTHTLNDSNPINISNINTKFMSQLIVLITSAKHKNDCKSLLDWIHSIQMALATTTVFICAVCEAFEQNKNSMV